MWDANPVYTLHFWSSYENVLQLIGFQEDREELVNPRIAEEVQDVGEMEEEDAVDESEDYDWRYEEYYGSDTEIDDDYSDWGDDLDDLPSMDDIVSFM